MASGAGSRVEEQPPVLPVKQHRSQSFRRSSVESDCVMLSTVGLQHQNYAYNDVFPEPTDCHAARCPIHQRYDPSRHQVRFFSDGTPPPVPKKRLVRTLSLPVTDGPPLSPLSPLQRYHQNFDNPLYMLAPIPDTYFHEETLLCEFKPVRGSHVPLLSLSQLSFDTPDEHLPYLFSCFEDQRVVCQEIQHHHLLFLRSMAQSVEARILLKGEAAERHVSSYQPQDFLLCEGSEPKQIGDTVYYGLHSPKLPGRVLGLRVHKETDEASSAHTKHQPSHVNVQDVIARFHPSRILQNDSSILQTQDPSHPFKSDCTAAKPTGGGSTEDATDLVNINLPSVQSFLQKGHSFSIERDLPHATLEDFVQDSSLLQSTDCLDYDRQVCILLLQILMGSQHLCNISATAAEFRPQKIFLVWPNGEKEEGENKLEQDVSEVKQGLKTSRLKEEMEWEKTEKKGKIQMLWRTHGSPRVVITLLSSALAVPHPLTYMKSQIRALIQYCLNSQESLRSLGSVPTMSMSSYRRGLLYLASLLQSDSNEPQMTDMVAMLQVLLWGPRVPLFNHRGSVTTIVHNWLTIKRALLVMKLAERGLIQDQSVLDWEDCMCLQYLSFTDPETVVSVTSQLWLTLNVD
ncbi:inactive tyrosine-protein kinase PRAG1 [Siniperca chuatsi]|uniref:inactive tyrosine-protein kinase PRAG1 n=1 Tax=Siniperca chuatsi TaxID=119488 RepID=UPI001CE1327E|nr:inactive tyrosine-protein kinase PRAG1 [Siniperca chuatsi]